MKYQIRQGQEHKFAITENISDKEEFLYPAFRQALYALEKIVANAENFSSNSDFDYNSNIELYGYSQNIIAFSGVRGMGKTSAMVSLSRAMEAGKLPDNFASCHFVVLPPVDPTIMEKHQNIVKLLLSRMYRLAEETWRNAERTHCRNVTEARKNDLLTLFNDCISSLDAIKNVDNLSASNLSAISKISDSSILKQQLYELVELILVFTKKKDSCREFLVIQLDDTDTSTSKCYEILEDLRKFLSIPNVIILMATDMKLLRTVILQHYIDEFSSCRKEDVLSVPQLEKMESKYIDKIIPPTHAVHLPKLDEYVVNYEDVLKLSYTDSSGKNNLLFINHNKDNPEEHLSAQELILRYIYRKTGIVFVAPSSHYHSIIPTTLRGLSQFLAVLSSMKDIPTVAEFDKPKEFKNSVREYIQVSEDNINRFEKYFLNEWAEAKLSQLQASLITDIANVDSVARFAYIADSIAKFYPTTKNPGASILPHEKWNYDATDYKRFVHFMNDCEKEYRHGTDIYFFFAIKTCLTILYHKASLSIMRKTLNSSNESGLLLFDFSPDQSLFPIDFIISDMWDESVYNEVVFKEANLPASVSDDAKTNIVSRYLYRQHYSDLSINCFALTNLIALALTLGNKNLYSIFDLESQKQLYELQINALTVVTNIELHKTVFDVIENCKETKYKRRLTERMNQFYSNLAAGINNINKKVVTAPQMLHCDFNELQNLVKLKQSNKISFMFEEISKKVDEPNEMFYVLYSLYSKALEAEKEPHEGACETAKTNITQLITAANQLYQTKSPDSILFDANFMSKFEIPNTDNAEFMSYFMDKFEALCRVCDVKIEDLKAKAEAEAKV